ncbi:MAG: glutamate 5-kinase [Actinomycetaceae bacterium]|nr:glutamate 5-kinase [Actinomycetaceae bacterium]
MKEPLTDRSLLGSASRLVVKVGSSSLTLSDGSLNLEALSYLAGQLIEARGRGQQVVLVSSGARAAGTRPLGLNGRPREVRLQQAAAMVGQSRLMAAYEREFGRAGTTIGQVLLTVSDVVDRRQYANAQESLSCLLDLGIIPIVNENDAVVTEELRFGDNDRLAALTAHLVAADALILLTDVDGLYTAPPKVPGARLIEEVSQPGDLGSLRITGRGSDFGTGGMRTKVDAARLATSGGVPALLTAADRLGDALRGERVGTWFEATGVRTSARKLWIEHAAQVCGQIVVDDGAAAALRRGGASLLHVGVTGFEGRFDVGELVEIVDEPGGVVARGLAGYSSEQLGSPDARFPRPVVHLNDLVLVGR